MKPVPAFVVVISVICFIGAVAYLISMALEARKTKITGQPSEWEEINRVPGFTNGLTSGFFYWAVAKVCGVGLEKDVRISPNGASGLVIMNFRHKRRRFVPIPH